MRGNEAAEPLLLEEGRQLEGVTAEAEEPPVAEERRRRSPRRGGDGGGGIDVGNGSKAAAGGGSAASLPASRDDSGGAVSTSSGGGQPGEGRGEAVEEAPLSDPKEKVSAAATAPGPHSDGENVLEAAAELAVSSSVHFECKRQMRLELVLLETAFDVLQLIQTELELGICSVLLFRHGLLACLSLLMAVWDFISEVKEEIEYQRETKWQSCSCPSTLCCWLGRPSPSSAIIEDKVQRRELDIGSLAKMVVPVFICLGLFPKEAVPFGTWWNRKLQHAARVIAVAQLDVRLNLMILLSGCASALYTVATAALSGKFGTLEKVTAVNAVQTILFILYKSHRQRRRMLKLEAKLQKLREDRTLGWEVREKLQQLQQKHQVSLSEKVMRFHDLVLEYPEHFFADNNKWRESEDRYIDVHSVPSDPARTGARGGVPALEEVSRFLGLKLDNCTQNKEATAARADSAGKRTTSAVDLALSVEEAAAILLMQGEAGAGKSTLAKLVALRATKASLDIERRHRESRSLAASVAPLVVYLHCAQHHRESSSRVSLRSHLEALLLGDTSQVSDKDWSSFLEETPIVLVLDAYDEADSHFTLREVLERDGLTTARSLRIIATARSGTFETDEKAKETFACEINGRRVSPTMRWLRPIGDEEQRSSALAPLEASDDFWQNLHRKHPGLARVATTPLMAALMAQAHKESALESLGRENCGDGEEAMDRGDNNVEVTLGSRIYKNRVRRRAHLISWHLKRQVQAGITSLHTYADIDLVLHKLLLCVSSSDEVWMKAGQLVARKLASLMWLRDTTVLRVAAPQAPGSDSCLTSLLAPMASLCPCCSGASADGSYSRVDTEVADTARGSSEQMDENDDIGRQLRSCLCDALPVELQAHVEEVQVHVMLLYLLGFCCSLKFLRTEDTGACEVAFTHDSFRACRLAEAMASYQDHEEAAFRLWACRLLLVDEHKDLITLLADITLSSASLQSNLWRCIENSKLQPGSVKEPRKAGKHSRQKRQTQEASLVAAAAANAATVLTCAQVSFSGRDLSRAQLSGACLRGAVCHMTNFDGANLQGTDLSHILAEKASFRGAQLKEARYGEYAMLQGHVAVFSPDSSTIASCLGRNVEVRDAASGALLLTLPSRRQVYCIAYSPDGGTIASGSDDMSIRLWDAVTGSHLRTLPSDPEESDPESGPGSVQSHRYPWSWVDAKLAYSLDGRTIAMTARWCATIELWDVTSGVLTCTMDIGEGRSIRCIAYHPECKAMAVASGNDILLWDVVSGSHTMTLEGHSAEVFCVAFSPEGRTIASGSCNQDGTIRLWDAAAGSHLLTWDGHSDHVTAIAYSPDGYTIASGGEDSTIRLWEATSGSHILTLAGHRDVVKSVVYSPDGRSIASGSGDDTIRLWDAVPGSDLLQREGHNDPFGVAFSPDGSTIAGGACFDSSIRLWDAKSGCHMLTLNPDEGESRGTWGFAFSPDGKWIASPAASGSDGSDPGIHLWDAASGERQRLSLKGLRHEVTDVAFSPDGRTLATWKSGTGTINMWDTVTWSYRNSLYLEARFRVRSIAFSPDSRTIAAAVSTAEHCHATIPVWDVESGWQWPSLEGHSSGVLSVAFSPDSSTCKLASGSLDHTILVWDAESSCQLLCLRGHSDPVQCVAFSSEGRTILSYSWDGAIGLWDATTGVCSSRLCLTSRLSPRHPQRPARLEHVAFSPEGRTMAGVSREDSTDNIQVWKFASSKLYSWEAAEEEPRHPVIPRSSTAAASPEGSDCRWLLQRSIECAEPALQATDADFRGALGLGANAKLMLQQKGAKVD